MDGKTEAYIKMMTVWLDASKSCGQLATAALFLPVFYNREIVGVKAETALRVYFLR